MFLIVYNDLIKISMSKVWRLEQDVKQISVSGDGESVK